MAPPIVVVVLGMHRSGTSALARALLELGVSLSPNLMPGSSDNPKGYWEDLEIYALNERLLETLGHRWHSVAPIDPSAWQHPEIGRLSVEALAVVRDRLAASPVWGFKDPRTARLLPFWKSVLSRSAADIRYLIVCRSPISVAKSLAKRDGFAAEKSYLLWLQHLIPAIHDTVDASRIVVDYDNLVTSPERELVRISSALALQPPNAAEVDVSEHVTAFVATELRHSVFSAEDLALDPKAAGLVHETNCLLQALARDEKHLSDPGVVEAAEELSGALESFGPFAAYLERRERDLESMHGQLAHEHEATERTVTALEMKLHERDACISSLSQAAIDRDRQIASLNQSVNDLTEMAVRHGEWARRLDSELRESQSKLTTILGSKSWRMTAPLREARRWVDAPRTQSKRYAQAALRRLKRR